MRTVRPLAVFLIAGGFLVPAALRADPADDSNPAAYDPDATPRAYSDTPRHAAHPSAAQMKAQRDQAQQQNDWLVRGYEEQLQARALADGQGQNNNLYSEITSNPDLAKAAGLSPGSAADKPAPAEFRTGQGTGAPSLSLRSGLPAPASSKGDLAETTGLNFKPFITPLDSSGTASLRGLFERLPELSAENAPAEPDPVAASDPGALDIPGMTAAESDPAKKESLDLTLDPLPGEPESAAKPHDSLALALPEAHDTDQVRKQQDAAVTAPGARKTAPPAPINPLLLKPVESDTSNMVPIPPPMRGQVADPYDILR